MAATIRDVARAAGVSPSTVSRALSTPGMVTPGTRERVIRAAARLGYRGRRAGVLPGARARCLGAVVPDLLDPVVPGVVRGLRARAGETGHAVLLVETGGDHVAPVARTLAGQVDGVVLVCPDLPEEGPRALVGPTPVVLVDRVWGDVPSVCFDDVPAYADALRHLTALGHRRLAWVEGPGASGAGAPLPGPVPPLTPLTPLRTSVAGVAGGEEVAEAVLATGATAVLCQDDLLALGLVHRLSVLGVDVPGRVSVVGRDDLPAAALCRPGLTTVRPASSAAGRAAADLLLGLLGRGPSAVRGRVPASRLLVRSSTGAAPDRLYDAMDPVVVAR